MPPFTAIKSAIVMLGIIHEFRHGRDTCLIQTETLPAFGIYFSTLVETSNVKEILVKPDVFILISNKKTSSWRQSQVLFKLRTPFIQM